VTEHWHRLPRDTVVLPPWSYLKASGHGPGPGGSRWLFLSRPDDLQRCLSTSIILSFCEL